MSETVIQFECGDSGCQIRSNVVPRVGCKFEFWSSRDDHGNYMLDLRRSENPSGRVEKKFIGIVRKIEYLFEESGNNPANNAQTMYVKVYCDPVEEGK